jgi:hypothetical protein
LAAGYGPKHHDAKSYPTPDSVLHRFRNPSFPFLPRRICYLKLRTERRILDTARPQAAPNAFADRDEPGIQENAETERTPQSQLKTETRECTAAASLSSKFQVQGSELASRLADPGPRKVYGLS